MSETSKIAADVAGQSAHIGALPAFAFENSAVLVRHLDEIKAMDDDGPGLDLNLFAAARQLVGALAADLYR